MLKSLIQKYFPETFFGEPLFPINSPMQSRINKTPTAVKTLWLTLIAMLVFSSVAQTGCSKEAGKTVDLVVDAAGQGGIAVAAAVPINDWKKSLDTKVKTYVKTTKETGKRPPKVELLAEIDRFRKVVAMSSVLTYELGSLAGLWELEIDSLQTWVEVP